MDECLALADLGASINLMPLSVWNKISLPGLSSTCMNLELADRSISRPFWVAEDVFIKGELSLRAGKESITFNLDQTSRYLANYNDMIANRINVIDMAYEEYSQDVLGFSDMISSGNPTPYYDPIVSTSSLTLTPFGHSDFLLKEEKSHFMVKEGIVLGHKISKNEIEVNKAKVEVIAKLPHPTTVKGIRSFLGHAGFYQRFIQDFSKIAWPMTHLLEKDTLFFSPKSVLKPFEHSKEN
nr:reverse transcriptase domain-containing protein [Tanacetum cinerariifolium]